jgi:hypothetical protein
MINPTAASATGTGSALRPFLRGIAGFLLAVVLVSLACTDSQAQQPPPRPGPPPAGPKAQPPKPAQSGPLEVDITQGTLKPIPIAVPEFLGEDPQFGREVSDVVAADLERSGLFEPLDRASFIDRARDLNTPPRFQDWRVINAQALVVGGAGRGADGRVVGEFRLWDVFTGRQLASQRFVVAPQEWRRLGHLIADQVYQRLTGEKGYFDTQIVFIDETGPKERRNKRLAMMDQDGANVRLLSQGRELVLTPRFSPTSQDIAYMQPGYRPARPPRQLSRHDVLAAILARWAAGRHEHRRGRSHEHRRDGPAQQADAPPDPDQRDRHRTLLQPGRAPHRLRIGP